MRVAIFSDVHGNLSALNAVLDHIDHVPAVDYLVFAGDLCLFGPRPRHCLELIRERNISSIVGNTDDWIVQPPSESGELDAEQIRRQTQIQTWIDWTKEQLGLSAVSWLADLRSSFRQRISPTQDAGDDLLIVHANPLDLTSIVFPSEDRQIALYGRVRQPDADLDPLFGDVVASIVAFGHLHIPSVRYWNQFCLVNISSVSLPGDGDARAKYAILTWDAVNGWSVEHQRVPYPIEDELRAYHRTRPPSWRESVEQLESHGFVPQVV